MRVYMLCCKRDKESARVCEAQRKQAAGCNKLGGRSYQK